MQPTWLEHQGAAPRAFPRCLRKLGPDHCIGAPRRCEGDRRPFVQLDWRMPQVLRKKVLPSGFVLRAFSPFLRVSDQQAVRPARLESNARGALAPSMLRLLEARLRVEGVYSGDHLH